MSTLTSRSKPSALGLKFPLDQIGRHSIKAVSPFDPEYIEGQDTVSDRWLNDSGRTMIARQVRDARFGVLETDLLIPVLTLVVAALALFKEIIVPNNSDPKRW